MELVELSGHTTGRLGYVWPTTAYAIGGTATLALRYSIISASTAARTRPSEGLRAGRSSGRTNPEFPAASGRHDHATTVSVRRPGLGARLLATSDEAQAGYDLQFREWSSLSDSSRLHGLRLEDSNLLFLHKRRMELDELSGRTTERLGYIGPQRCTPDQPLLRHRAVGPAEVPRWIHTYGDRGPAPLVRRK